MLEEEIIPSLNVESGLLVFSESVYQFCQSMLG